MDVVVIGVCFVITGFSWLKERNLHNPMFLMSALWGLITFFARMRLYNMYGASEMTYVVILCGIIAFGVGGLISSAFNNVRVKYPGHQKLIVPSENALLYTKITRILCGISVLMLVYPTYKSIGYIASGLNLTYIRSESNVIVYSNPILRIIYNYMVRPFSFAVLPIFAVDIFTSQMKKDKIIAISSILIVIERVLIEGGRFVILYLVCNILICYVVTKKKKIKINKSIVLLLVFVVGAAVYSIYKVTISRGTEDIGYSLYVYFCGVIPNLSIRLERLVYAGQYTYGVAFFNGILSFIFAMFENLGFPLPVFFTEAQALMNVEDGVAITSAIGSSFNAFVGPYFYMYLDAGYVGVILGMMVYGMIAQHYYLKVKNKFNYRDLAVYLLIAQGIITSMVRFQFVNVYYTLAFFYLYFLINKRKKGKLMRESGRK